MDWLVMKYSMQKTLENSATQIGKTFDSNDKVIYLDNSI